MKITQDRRRVVYDLNVRESKSLLTILELFPDTQEDGVYMEAKELCTKLKGQIVKELAKK